MLNARSVHVLVAFPDAQVACALGSDLARAGFRASVVGAMRQALEVEAPTIAFVSCDFPNALGFELATNLLRRDPSLRVVMTAARPDFAACQRALRIGAVDFVVAPFASDAFVATIERVAFERLRRSNERAVRRWRGAGEVEDIDPLLRSVLAWLVECGFGPSSRARVIGALAEVLDNVRIHAYGEALGEFEVEARVGGRELVIDVADRGIGFDATNAALEALSPHSSSGLGRARALCEDLRIESTCAAGTHVCLTFAAWRAVFDERASIDLSEHDYLSPELARRVLASFSDAQADPVYELSPALAVSVGRLLARPRERRTVQQVLWS